MKKKKEDYTDKELREIYGLSDWEIKQFREGHYNTWNFEEEDLEEDDYYYGDLD